MDRVQYHLERLLPTLQLLSQLSLLSATELQALTHTRRHHETALITPASSPATFLQYVAFELDVEKLVLLRISRAGKDPETGDDRVTVKDRSMLRRGMEKHIISIWQRLIAKKARKEPNVYSLYLDFLQQRKMRRVYGEVAAQGLSMHPSEAALWIRVADWELNNNTDASAARITLLRGIRLNTSMAEQSSNGQQHQPPSKGGAARRKKMKMSNGAASQEVEFASVSSSDAARLSLHSLPTSSTRNVLDLWVQYFRMELVFLERLRRRWAVLGINATSQPTQEASTEAQEEATSPDGEEEDQGGEGIESSGGNSAMQKIRQGDEDEDGGAAQSASVAAAATAPSKVLSGALPLAIFSSALALTASSQEESIIKKAGPSLPAQARLAFILAVTEEVQKFPFARLSGEDSSKGDRREDGEELRSALLQGMALALSPLAQQSPGNAKVLTLARQSTSLRTLTEDLNRRSQEEARLFLSEEERREEDRKELAVASVLRPSYLGSGAAAGYEQASWTRSMGEASGLLIDFKTGQKENREREAEQTEEQLLSQFSLLLRSLADGSSAGTPSGQVQLLLARKIKEILDDMRNSDGDSLASLRMKVAWSIWRVYAYLPFSKNKEDSADEESSPSFSPFEIGLGAQARQDPLLPYLASTLQRIGQEQIRTSTAEQQEVRLLTLIFRYQKLLHTQALAQEGEEDKVTEAWDELLSIIKEREASSPLLERCFTHLHARVWSSKCAWQSLLRDTNLDEEEEETGGLAFWSSLLDLTSSSLKTSVSPYARVARKTFKLFHLWCLSLPSSSSTKLVKALESLVRLTRGPLVGSASPTLEERKQDQELHDEALYVYIIKSSSSSSTLSTHPKEQVKILTDTHKSSPSLHVYFRLLDDRFLLAATRAEVFTSLQTLAGNRAASFFSPSSDRAGRGPQKGGEVAGEEERADLLEAFGRLFRNALYPVGVEEVDVKNGEGSKSKAGDTRGAVHLLHLARRAGRGEERWEAEVEAVWASVCHAEEEQEEEEEVESGESGESDSEEEEEEDSESGSEASDDDE
ncbi:hypothetical protein BCV69DRAFT_281469 [Microstroma glucosiphilum]|uniref:U3 small nucleolar RNA-associated protein 6 N-terminal domain-containing protein n=1 Tax=Pseudomicrostroma glucosiphilum TaxID=1684307 RepID=A0A316UB81_9BASI|nr:hypothetical protein BCV69DRAFT_281469 [Pseudomicrostroma glucosiphilum]PWN22477.1 hypothetical protein BCV69DRAFT_281469 [Pseudomicrostroma glucosiphilum]